MKYLFSFKTFRKNIGFVIFGVILLPIMDVINHSWLSVAQIIQKDVMILFFFILLGMVTDVVQETRQICKKPNSKREVICNILLVIVLVALLVVDSWNIPIF